MTTTLSDQHDDPPVLPVGSHPTVAHESHLRGKRVAMVALSPYPDDPRIRRTIDALLADGMTVDLYCLGDGKAPRRQVMNGIDVWRIPLRHRRQGRLAYAYEYSAFIAISTVLVALRSLTRTYDLIYVNNMPDILILSALIPKTFGAKVVLDLHDPMPELMMTIFRRDAASPSVRLLKFLEKWSIGRADLVMTVNMACKRLFAERSSHPGKIGVVMNAPDEELFPVRKPEGHPRDGEVVPERFVLMYHGSLVERNGLDLAVVALSRVVRTIPEVELRIVGYSTPFLESVMHKVNDCGLGSNVQFLGPRQVEDLPREIERCDLGVIPNRHNPFTELNMPTRIFEYLTIGKPVIAPRTPGIQDYFSQDSLVFFEPGNAEDLAEKIEKVYFDRAMAIETAKRGQQICLAHTWAREKEALRNMIGALLAESSIRATGTALPTQGN